MECNRIFSTGELDLGQGLIIFNGGWWMGLPPVEKIFSFEESSLVHLASNLAGSKSFSRGRSNLSSNF